MIKKLISTALIIFLIFSAIPFSVSAVDGIIAFPKNNSVIDIGTKEFSIKSPAGSNVTLLLDGESLAEFVSTGTNSVDVTDLLTVGSHTLTAAATGSNGIEYDKISFDVKKETADSHMTESFAGGAHGDLFVPQGAKEVGVNSAGEKIYIKSQPVEGKNGEVNGAVGFVITDDVEGTMVNASRAFQIDAASFKLSSCIELEYDLKLCGIGAFEIETKNSKGGFGSFGPLKFFAANGTTVGSDYEYPKNEWIHMKHVVDIRGCSRKESLYVTDAEGEHTIFSDRTVNSNVVANLSIIKMQFYPTAKFSGLAFAIDNLSLRDVHKYEPLGLVSYADENGDYAVASDGIIDKTSAKIILDASASGIPKSTDMIGKVTAKADAKSIAVKSAATYDNGKLIIEFEAPLPSTADITVSVQFADVKGNPILSTKSFKVRSFEFGLEEVTFTSDGKPVISPNQLSSVKKLSCNFKLKNSSAEARSGIIIACIYNGNRLAAMNVADVSLAPHTSTPVVQTLDVTVPDEDGSFSAECYLFDSFLKRLPISKVWSVK